MVKKAACLLATLACADDEFTMLSVRHAASLSTHSTLDALESVVDSRNVTQMALLVENIAKESLSGDLDESIKTALKGLEVLVKQIKDAMRTEHNTDQTAVNALNQCFTNAINDWDEEKEDVAMLAEQMTRSYGEFSTCRGTVHDAYVHKILECEALDAFVAGLGWFEGIEQECVYSDSDRVGAHILKGQQWYETNYAAWQGFHRKCSLAVADYDEKDHDCDRVQGTYEVDTCAHRQASWTACNDHFMSSCKACSIAFDEKVSEVECREKDRKVDFSAAEKIQCYVNVLLATPSEKELQENCDANGENCLTNTRIKQYKECENVCHEVDYESGSYQVIDGVNTTHRIEEEDDEKRCTRELDINFPAKLGCEPCPDPLPYPCQTEFVKQSYSAFQSEEWADGVPTSTKECPGYMHRDWFAYNLEECRPCPALVGRDPTHHDAKCQVFGDEVKIQTDGSADSYLNIMEVKVNEGKEKLTAQMSSQWGNLAAANCVDGDVNTMCHAQFESDGGWLSVKLSAPTCIENIFVANRRGQLSNRLLGGSIKVLNQGTKTWQGGFAENRETFVFTFEGSTSYMGDFFASVAGEYEVWYRGAKRSTGAVVGCDGSIEQPGIFADALHTTGVREKCRQPRDAKATFVVYGTHGAGKYECLWVEGNSIKGEHYTGDQQYWGTIEYRLKSSIPCSGVMEE